MKKIISFKAAANCCIVIYGIFILFHISLIFLVGIFNAAPIDFVWGGQLQTAQQLVIFELVSTVGAAIGLFLTLIHSRYVDFGKFQKLAHIFMWIFAVLFLFNSVGNLYSKTTAEKLFIFGSLPLAVCSLRLAIERWPAKSTD